MAAMANKTASSEEGEREEDGHSGTPTDGLVVSRHTLNPPKREPRSLCLASGHAQTNLTFDRKYYTPCCVAITIRITLICQKFDLVRS